MASLGEDQRAGADHRLRELPKFNLGRARRIGRAAGALLNRLSPLLFVPYVPVVLALNVWNERGATRWRANLRMAFYQGMYAGMVQFYVAKYTYLGGRELGRVRSSATRLRCAVSAASSAASAAPSAIRRTRRRRR